MESMKRSFSPDDLPMVNGRVYHLDLAPEELAQNVMVVGDPDRVPLLADEFFLEREVDRFHRGFRTITGVARETGLRVSLVTTGIGAPSTEIVLNELAALNEIDFRTMTRKETFEPLNVIRVGTSGGLDPATPVGALVITDYVIGLDNTGLSYDAPLPDSICALLEEQARKALHLAADPQARFQGTIVPYAARADRTLLEALEREASALGIAHARGITVSSSGFFAEQERGVARVGSTLPRLLDALVTINSPRADLKIENMEMEAGILLHFLGGLGYRAAAICVVVNKRHEGTFLADYRQHIFEAARIAFRALKQCGGDR
jgi:uridine phosphorylase